MAANPNGFEITRIAEHLYSFPVPNIRGPSGQPTNVYVVGREPVTLVDAGSDDGGVTVLAALERLGIERVDKILITHAHHDHVGSAAAVREATGATVFVDERDLPGSGFHVEPDEHLPAGTTFDAGPYTLTALSTPGHAPGHISFFSPQLRALFAGDLMSGNGTVAVIPPRGSMSAYLNSLRSLIAYDIDIVYPGHGPAIENGAGRVQEYIEHRERREEEILELIVEGVGEIEDLVEQLYPDVLPRLRPLAAGTVLAHIVNLMDRSRIRVGQEAPQLLDSHFVAVESQGD